MDSLRRFNEKALAEALTALTPSQQTAFALSIATRQLLCFERLAHRLQWEHADQPRAVVERLWSTIRSGAIDHDLWRSQEELVLSWIPHVEDDDWTFEHAFVQEALSSLVYSIRSLLTAKPQEAAWAATAAYDSTDQAAIWFLGIRPESPAAEAAILSHPIIQREFERQAEAIDWLKAGSISEVQKAAFAHELITDTELAHIAARKQSADLG